MFESQFMQVMMLEFWESQQWKVISRWFIPQLSFVLTSIHYFAATLQYEFENTSKLYKISVIFIQGSIILTISLYLGYRETINAIMFYTKKQNFDSLWSKEMFQYLLKILGAICWHVLYYGPTYYAVIYNMNWGAIDFQS